MDVKGLGAGGTVFIRTAILAAGLLVALAACSSTPETADLTVTRTGVGPLNASTPYSATLVQNMLPGFTVTSGRESNGFDQLVFIKVGDEGGELLDLLSDQSGRRVEGIMVHSPRIQDATGARVGMPFYQIYGASVPTTCLPGWDASLGNVTCPAPNAPNVYYVFNGPGAPASKHNVETRLPPYDVLRYWPVIGILWTRATYPLG